MALLLLKVRAQTVELRVPEFLVVLQPLKCTIQCAVPQLTVHHAAGLSPLDKPGVFQNAEMLDESRKRHAKGLGQLAYRTFALPKPSENRTPRRVSQRTEDGVELADGIVNHKVKRRREF